MSFGTVPDFAFEGPGVRVAASCAGSPAEKAGIQEGDVLRAIDGKPVANLQAFSSLLATYAPGQTVTATLSRDGKDATVTLTLIER